MNANAISAINAYNAAYSAARESVRNLAQVIEAGASQEVIAQTMAAVEEKSAAVKVALAAREAAVAARNAS